MDVFDAVRTVLAVRSYRDEPVPAEVIERVVEAARLTASSQNKQPWHFVVVEGREALQALGALCTSGSYTSDAGFAVVVTVDSASRSGTGDIARAIQSMVLTAWESGVGSNWVGVPREPEVKELLGIPESMRVAAVVPFGYPATQVGAGKKDRKPTNEIASRGRYGTPFAS